MTLIILKSNLLEKFASTTTDEEVWVTCKKIATENEAVFIRRPVFEKKALSAILGKSYIKSDTLHDSTEKFYHQYFQKEIAHHLRV
jgi:hypothetical protein